MGERHVGMGDGTAPRAEAGSGMGPGAGVTANELDVGVYHDLVQSIVSALEARDPHAAEHSLRVGDMTERTCLLMGLEPELAATIHMAAHVHDIGKVGIPDAVLLKRGRLTPKEREVLQGHARIGAQIIGSCPSLVGIARIVLHHHERWDGSGYPDGLAGTDIPLGSRIIAVTDSIDAMLGKRVARKSLTQAECSAEIRSGAGSAYDPAITRFVLDHWDQIVGPVDFRDSDDFDKGRLLALAPRPALHCAVPAPLARTGATVPTDPRVIGAAG
ncbi:MAG: HD domain-containing phosphohydrolase [Coriobacteriales bacterium]|jgi:response regulator RpfG family c-di-GMP phosphodiesterase